MNKEEFRIDGEDKQLIGDMAMKLVDYSLDDIEVFKTILLKNLENEKNAEALKHCATRIIDITIQAKKRLGYKL